MKKLLFIISMVLIILVAGICSGKKETKVTVDGGTMSVTSVKEIQEITLK